MKKNIKSLLLVMLVGVLLTGCKLKEDKTVCKLSSDQSASGYKTNITYTVYSKDKIVNKVVIEEVIESKNNTVLAYYEKQLTDLYKSNNKTYGGYEYKITNKDGKVTLKVTTDYNKMNFKKFITDNPAIKDYINKDNKLTLDGIKKMYELSGATCEK